jgi:hypothetical protein
VRYALGRYALLLAVLLGTLLSHVAFVPDAHAQREIKFKRYVPTGITPCTDNPSPEASPNPCTKGIEGSKYSGGCTYYEWGDDASLFNEMAETFEQIEFTPGTVVTPEIFRALGGTDTMAVVNVTLSDSSGYNVKIGEKLPAGVIVPDDQNGGPVYYSGLTNRLVTCIREVVLKTIMAEQLKIFAEPMKQVTFMLITLAIMLYGIEVTLGKEGARKPGEALKRVLLIAGVLAFTSQKGITDYVGFFVGGQDELSAIVSGSMKLSPTSTTTQGFSSFCGQSQKKYLTSGVDASGAPVTEPKERNYNPWERVDCIIASGA